MADDHHLCIVIKCDSGINDYICLPLQLIEQALAEIAVERDVIGIVMMFVFARGINMSVSH